jgi:hypothetical protein
MSFSNQNHSVNNTGTNNNGTINRILLDFYIGLYNQTLRRIDSLYDILDEIRESINILGGIIVQPRYPNNRSQGHGRGHSQGRGFGSQGRGQGRGQDQRTHSFNRNVERNNTIYIQGRPYSLEVDRFAFDNLPINTSENNTLFNLFQNFYSNVQVAPTSRQIQNATRQSPFSQIQNPLNISCPITLEPFSGETVVTEILGCHHLFSQEAATSWFQNNVRCPVCRYDIRTYRETSHEPFVEETKEAEVEAEAEETKEAERPNPRSSTRTTERNSNIRFNNSTNINDALSDIAESVLGQIFNTRNTSTTNRNNRSNRIYTNNYYDASNNEIIFSGFRI